MPFLTEHIKKDWIEAFPGDEVTIVGDHGNVQIVSKDGIAFAVKTDYLSEIPVSTIKEKRIDKQIDIKPKQRWKKNLLAITQSLF